MDARDLLDLVWIVPALPALGAAILLLVGRRLGEPKAGWLATGLMALSFAWSVVMLLALRDVEPRTNTVDLFTWFPTGGLQVKLGFLADPLSITFILFVTGVGTLIHLYSIGYMHGDENFGRFFAFMNLFCASMLVLVLGSSFLVTFLGWEGVGLCSYLLVSFWFQRNSAAVAGKKAFITTRVGDFGFMVAMFLIFAELGSLDYGAMSAGAHTLAAGTATAIALLLFLGAVGKSAQFPLHVWLPDAMEGPTPVSALIHAATMVTAGVFLVARAHPFFEASGGSALTVVSIIGAVTALLAATVALIQVDIKRVLAYSTISQLGYMFLALGVRAYAAAIFLVVAHAFYKATLFLGAGSVIHGNADNQDIRTMGGMRKYMPYTALGFIIAWLAIAGVPPLAGFWAKDEVLSRAFFAGDYGVWVVGTAAALLTAFYMTRAVWLVFFGNERFQAVEPAAEAEEHGFSLESPTVPAYVPPKAPRLTHPPHESPVTMTFPIVALAGLAAIGGLLSLPFKGVEFLNDWLEPVFEDAQKIDVTSFVAATTLEGISVVFAIVGLAIAVAWYRRGIPSPEGDPLPERLGFAGRLFQHAYYFDEAIANLVRGPVTRGAEWLNRGFDLGIIDGAVNGVATLVRESGGRLRRVQTGLVRNYALAVVLGAVAVIVFLAVRAG
ncbi:MAG TPA: NADH-quinone oxidoreductase subunit L [Acidimicrobiia bacterium]|nr:NADH-quinone oxidoreductase subunit L [Acidimicrobiia bacterium]